LRHLLTRLSFLFLSFVEGGSAVGSVKLKDGQTLPADVVILGVGVGPQTDYLKNLPDFNLQKDGSLKVDRHFRVEGSENIYATGILRQPMMLQPRVWLV
jgi:pyruvate/2-oxoglutarate dehydrogenase complex dihydrolipoamide dehydrogenase (E3) component